MYSIFVIVSQCHINSMHIGDNWKCASAKCGMVTKVGRGNGYQRNFFYINLNLKDGLGMAFTAC